MAAAYRDAIRTVEDVSQHQLVQSLKGENVDVFGFFEAGNDVAVCLLVVRGGVVQDRRDFFFEKSEEVDPGAFLEAFLPQFYDVNPFLPEEVHLPAPIGSPALLSEFLTARRRGRVRVRVPRRGPAAERVALASENAPRAAPGPLPPGRRTRAARARAAGAGPRPAGAARPHRGLRHLAPAGDRQRRVARRLRGREAQEVGLPPLRHRVAEPARARRLPEHGRGRRAALPAPARREPAACRTSSSWTGDGGSSRRR